MKKLILPFIFGILWGLIIGGIYFQNEYIKLYSENVRLEHTIDILVKFIKL